MTDPVAPYFVHFSAEPVRSATIVSTATPGGSSSNAGHTSARFAGRLTWRAETGAPRADGSLPFYFRSVNVYFFLANYLVEMSSTYARESCAYQATMRHETGEHILNPTGVMFSFREPLIVALNGLRLPTVNSPLFIRASQSDATESSYIERVAGIVKDFDGRIRAEMQRARIASDSAASYRLVHAQCPAREW